MEIRQFLTDLIGAGGIAKVLEASLRAMRAACHKFLEDLGPLNAWLHSWQARRWHGGYGGLDDYLLNQALGALPAASMSKTGSPRSSPPPTRNLDQAPQAGRPGPRLPRAPLTEEP